MSAWKDLELRVCRRWRGERTGPVGRDGPDCRDVPVAIQVKRNSLGTGGIMGSWVQQAKRDAKRFRLPWVLVVGTPGSPDQVAACDHAWLADLYLAAEDARQLLADLTGEDWLTQDDLPHLYDRVQAVLARLPGPRL